MVEVMISKSISAEHTFFNPPRYLRLFEIIPGKETDPEVLEFLEMYGEKISW